MDIDYSNAIDTARHNLVSRIDVEIPEIGPFKTIYEYFDNIDDLSKTYVGKFGLYIYHVPDKREPSQGNRFIEVAAYDINFEYKATTLIAYGNNTEIKSYLESPKCRQDVIDNLEMLVESIMHQ